MRETKTIIQQLHISSYLLIKYGWWRGELLLRLWWGCGGRWREHAFVHEVHWTHHGPACANEGLQTHGVLLLQVKLLMQSDGLGISGYKQLDKGI